ncbi:MAG: hypothetical protein OSA97_06140 [Nevskia sp.]|nr:hypothetical protein [Nevskia sp.]
MHEPRLLFESQEYADITQATLPTCELLFQGTDIVDERGEAVTARLATSANTIVRLEYKPGTSQLLVDGKINGKRLVQEMLKGVRSIRIEATTLGMAEIMRVLQGAQEEGLDYVDITYVEPESYAHQGPVFSESGLLPHRNFPLTSNHQFKGLAGFSHEYQEATPAHHVFFLGFEPWRIEHAFEQRDNPDPKVYTRTAVIGIPAFTPGWENNVYASHAETLQTKEFTAGDIRYCCANSAREAYLLLWELWRMKGDVEQVFFVSPLGTKPHTVGAALFLLETHGFDATTALYYDHPKRNNKRSKNVSKWHFWRVHLRQLAAAPAAVVPSMVTVV